MGCASIGGISETRRPLRIWESNGLLPRRTTICQRVVVIASPAELVFPE
jgi:hypothetical protein